MNVNVDVTYDFAKPAIVAPVEADLDYAIDYLRRSTSAMVRQMEREVVGG